MSDEDIAADLAAHVAQDPANRARLLKDPHRMRAIAADLAATDPALRNALVAVVDLHVDRVFLGDAAPTPNVLHDIVQRLVNQQGIQQAVAERCVRILSAAFLTPHPAPPPRPTPPPDDPDPNKITILVAEPVPVAGFPRWKRAPILVGGGVVGVVVVALAAFALSSAGKDTGAGPGGTPSTPGASEHTTTEPAPPPTETLSTDQQALVARLPSDLVVSGSCNPYPAGEDPTYTLAVVRCSPAGAASNGPNAVLVLQYRSPKLLQDDLANNTTLSKLSKGHCSTPPAHDTWSLAKSATVNIGQIYCYPTSTAGRHAWLWTYDKDAVLVDAVGPNAKGLYDWFYKLPQLALS